MEINKHIQHKLETLLSFQEKYPNSHVGGSIGLMIYGIDLKRNLSSSDLDITTDVFNADENTDLENRSDGNDFDFAVKKVHDDGFYTKIDIRITPEPSFEVMEFEGKKYNVSKLGDIIFWKNKYALKGVKKHQDDIITIATGIRPIEKIGIDDMLPF